MDNISVKVLSSPIKQFKAKDILFVFCLLYLCRPPPRPDPLPEVGAAAVSPLHNGLGGGAAVRADAALPVGAPVLKKTEAAGLSRGVARLPGGGGGDKEG